MKRVGILGILQESNTFISGSTTFDHFREDIFLTGEELRSRMADSPHQIGGFFAGLEAADIEAVPIFYTRARPFGTIEADAFTALVETLLNELKKAGPVDAILASPHGATVAENHPDGDGYWLTELRKAVGPDIPIVATIDPHANLSPAMVESTTALVAYATNPHLDQRETGIKAAEVLARILRGEISPTQAAAFPPMAINIQCQDTFSPPLSDFYNDATTLAAEEGALSHSIILGFPYADVAEMGSATLAITDNDPALAIKIANHLGDAMWKNRHDFEPQFTTVGQAVTQALASEETPVVLLDMGDNVGGGSPGDGTIILAELHERHSADCFVCLHDPDSVVLATAAGSGAELELTIGAGNDNLHGAPFTSTFRVCSLHDGIFTETEARHGGFTHFDQGATVILKTVDTGIIVMLTTRRSPPFSLAQLTGCGLDPHQFKIIVAKGVIAPLGAYRSVTSQFIHVDTPGVTRADMTKLTYHNRRKPMFPFENL
jgi:microcystin degradation protein MlrC